MTRRVTKRGAVWVCHACGATFLRYSTAEKHVDAEHVGGARIEQRARA